MDELYKKVIKILEIKFPVKEEREKLMDQAAKIILFESLELVMTKLPNDRERQTFAMLFKSGKLDETYAFVEKYGIDMDDIFDNRAKNVVIDLFG